jgi:hypothetical protein
MKLPMYGTRRERSLALTLLLLMFPATVVAVAAAYEPTTVRFKASKLLPAKLLKGPNHEILEQVENKGLMNHYRITSPFGDFTASADAMVEVRVHEIKAIAELQKMSKAEVFAQSAAEAAKRPVEAAQQLADKPVETVKGIPAGVGRLFARTKDKIEQASEKAAEVHEKETSGSGEEDSATDAAVEAGTDLAKSYFGVNSAQRKLARDLGVNPYSTNRVLQQELSSLAKYAAAGSFGTKLLMPSIPGVDVVTNVKDLVWNMSARDLRLQNAKSLSGIGADEALVDRFFDNPHYTPTDQTRFVQGLVALKDARNRAVAVTKAAAAQSRSEGLFYSRMSELLATYNARHSPVTELVDTQRRLPLARTRNGSTLLAVPVDYLNWTESTATGAQAIQAIAGKQSPGKKTELWVEGRVSDRARQELTKLGWVIHDRAFDRLHKTGAK